LKSRFKYLFAAACVALLASPAAAWASHNLDQHTDNMRLAWSFPEVPTRTHSDIAFWGNIGVSGNYDGFRIFNAETQHKYVNFLCRGPQNDVALWEHNGRMLLFMGIDRPQVNGATVCGQNSGTDTTVTDPAGWEGIRIFDITDPTSPVYLHAVRTNCGAHTLTLLPDLANTRVLIYATTASTSGGPYCQIPHSRIPIVAVPLNAPETASVIAQPSVFPSTLRGCHDITVFMAIDLAAASCESEGQFWDISDPANPGTLTPIARIDNPSVNYWHSAEFTWDGQYVVFDDETFASHGCSPSATTGRVWIFRVSDGALMSSFMTPRSLGSGFYCGSHNGNIVPTTDRYLLVMSWYGGGTSVVDFTNPASPVEIGSYRAVEGRGPADTWSSYWYNGRIFANDIVRGVDVFEPVIPDEWHGTTYGHLNAQTQEDLFLTSPAGSMTPVARLQQGALTGRSRPARAGIKKRATARGRAWLSRARAR
jgi:hypothetical protein